MKMICERCWERCCKCSRSQQEADRQKIIRDYAKSEGLPDGWQPGQLINSGEAKDR